MLESLEWTERFEWNSLIKVAGGGWSISIKGNQPLHSKFLLISGLSSSKTTFLSAHTDLRMFNFSYVSWFFSLINLSLSKDGVEEEVDVLWALVFLTMMLRIGKDTQKRDKRKKKKNKQKKKNKENPRADCIRQG